ncbi:MULTISPECIES: lysogeny pheromone AimP family peptide [Bacillus subtilis group]|nr:MULTISPECIES: lysogeny pheromone AimP family peptide [Bacillus subtilis group]MDY7216860.1 lysogeny pheromone AimP family peptide [Bacillus subtilis]
MRKVFIGLTILAALAIGFVAGQQSGIHSASGNETFHVAGFGRGA